MWLCCAVLRLMLNSNNRPWQISVNTYPEVCEHIAICSVIIPQPVVVILPYVVSAWWAWQLMLPLFAFWWMQDFCAKVMIT